MSSLKFYEPPSSVFIASISPWLYPDPLLIHFWFWVRFLTYMIIHVDNLFIFLYLCLSMCCVSVIIMHAVHVPLTGESIANDVLWIFSLAYNAGPAGAGVSAEYTGVSDLMKSDRPPSEPKFSEWNTLRIFLYLCSLKGGAFSHSKLWQKCPDSPLWHFSPETCVVNRLVQKTSFLNCAAFQSTVTYCMSSRMEVLEARAFRIIHWHDQFKMKGSLHR